MLGLHPQLSTCCGQAHNPQQSRTYLLLQRSPGILWQMEKVAAADSLAGSDTVAARAKMPESTSSATLEQTAPIALGLLVFNPLKIAATQHSLRLQFAVPLFTGEWQTLQPRSGPSALPPPLFQGLLPLSIPKGKLIFHFSRSSCTACQHYRTSSTSSVVQMFMDILSHHS